MLNQVITTEYFGDWFNFIFAFELNYLTYEWEYIKIALWVGFWPDETQEDRKLHFCFCSGKHTNCSIMVKPLFKRPCFQNVGVIPNTKPRKPSSKRRVKGKVIAVRTEQMHDLVATFDICAIWISFMHFFPTTLFVLPIIIIWKDSLR